MQSVFKYPISMETDKRVIMPEGAKVVKVGLDFNNEPCVWALVNPFLVPSVERKFGVYGTGGQVPDFWTYVGTFFDLPCIWHVFEENMR